MTCLGCGAEMRRHRVFGFIHLDGSYWCGDSQHASLHNPCGIYCCSAERRAFGF
jgi:hypothetical protein